MQILIETGPERVTCRLDLLDAVWDGREVGDEALTVVISRLRHQFKRIGITKDSH